MFACAAAAGDEAVSRAAAYPASSSPSPDLLTADLRAGYAMVGVLPLAAPSCSYRDYVPAAAQFERLGVEFEDAEPAGPVTAKTAHWPDDPVGILSGRDCVGRGVDHHNSSGL